MKSRRVTPKSGVTLRYLLLVDARADRTAVSGHGGNRTSNYDQRGLGIARGERSAAAVPPLRLPLPPTTPPDPPKLALEETLFPPRPPHRSSSRRP